MREINAAFQTIRHAPLRYHIEGHPRVAERAATAHRDIRRETILFSDRLEWAVRFILGGAALGLLVNTILTVGGTELGMALCIIIPAITGFLSAYVGNEFWSWIIE